MILRDIFLEVLPERSEPLRSEQKSGSRVQKDECAAYDLVSL